MTRIVNRGLFWKAIGRAEISGGSFGVKARPMTVRTVPERKSVSGVANSMMPRARRFGTRKRSERR